MSRSQDWPRALVAAARWPLAALALAVAACAVIYADLGAAERQAASALLTTDRAILLALMILPVLAWAIGYRAHRQIERRQASLRLADGIGLMARVNPDHRLAEPGQPELAAIARAGNALAEVRSALLVDVQATVAQAKARVEEEKDRFAALVSELEQSVLVCTLDGRILLYNAAVTALLDPTGANEAVQSIGLGRSAFGIIDRNLILHALETLAGQATRGERESAHFVTASADGRLLRVHVAPVFGAGAWAGAAAGMGSAPAAGPAAPTRVMTGFVLLLSDVTENIDSDARSVALFQNLVESTRGAIASIRAAIETMIEHPAMDAARRARFAGIVQTEAVRLSGHLDTLGADVTERMHQRWPLEEMRGADFLALAARRIASHEGLRARLDEVDPQLWLRVDSFTLVQAVSSLAVRLQEEFMVREVRFRLRAADRLAQLDLTWKGVPMSSETAFSWQNDAYSPGGDDMLSLTQVMDRHGGEIWYQRDAPSQTNYFRLLLPLASAQAAERARPWQPNRPEFYDFDLFRASSLSEALEGRRLAELTYTVFDTETTGLDPAAGDEIISIGAARIVNGRLLRAETFESLVDPQRGISPASIAIHGITPDLLAGQPKIGEVLPRFARFSADTVLVGHNAAFDMRFLQLKEASTGVKFRHPVLDTLLLGAVVHPSEPSQSLEAIATRLGISIIGRHTALGDALATAEVFLGLLPLLKAQGIETLGQALAAAEKTYYARIQY